MRKKYVYVGNPLPDFCNIQTERMLESAKEDDVFPHRWGLIVGENTDKYGLKSYLIADQNTMEKTVLEQLINGDIVEEYSRPVMRKNKDGSYEELYLTLYFLPYELEESTHRISTVEECIENAINVKTDALVEVKMVAGDFELERYITIPVKTAWPAISFIDIVNDLEEEFWELAENRQKGFSKEKEDEHTVWRAVFFNRLGEDTDFEFETLSELLRTIVSIRLVEVNNQIVK